MSDPIKFPYADQTLSLALRRETELFFDSLVREDRSVFDLLTADYTFVERACRAALRHCRTSRGPGFDASACRSIVAAFSATAAS